MTVPVRISLRIPGTAPMPQLMTLIQDVEGAVPSVLRKVGINVDQLRVRTTGLLEKLPKIGGAGAGQQAQAGCAQPVPTDEARNGDPQDHRERGHQGHWENVAESPRAKYGLGVRLISLDKTDKQFIREFLKNTVHTEPAP